MHCQSTTRLEVETRRDRSVARVDPEFDVYGPEFDVCGRPHVQTHTSSSTSSDNIKRFQQSKYERRSVTVHALFFGKLITVGVFTARCLVKYCSG